MSTGRYDRVVQALSDSVLDTPGESASALRRAVLERAKRPGSAARDATLVSPAVASYVDKVARHAYRVTDADLEALQDDNSDDKLFELTVAAAVGAALHRLERGMAALRGEEPD